MHPLRRYMEILAEAAFDPQRIERGMASFLFIDGAFVPVGYQRHIESLGDLIGVAVPGWSTKEFEARTKVYDELNAYAAQHGIVQGNYQPGGRNLKSFLTLKGTWPAIRAAYIAFRTAYPDLVAGLDMVTYDTLNEDGQRIASGDLEDRQIDRKLGRRD
jgi:hypothetical protein